MTQALKVASAAVLSVVVIGLLCGAVAAQARGPIEPPGAPMWGTPAPYFDSQYQVYEQSFRYTSPFSITDLRPEERYADKENFNIRTLTVYRPYTNGVLLQNRPVVFYIHGGGWTDGYAEWYSYTAKSLTGELGWVTVVVDYRLTSDEVFVADEYCPDKVTCALTQNVALRTKAAWYDDNITDVAAAFEWVHDNISVNGGDGRNIFVFGHSAGAHLATLLTTHPTLAALRPHIQGLISMSGAYDLTAFDDTLPEQVFWSASVSQTFPGGFSNVGLLTDASPVNYITTTTPLPPILIYYAEDDLLGLTQQAVAFDNLLTTQGHAHETHYLAGYGHVSEMDAIEFITSPVTIDLVNWLSAHVEYRVYLPVVDNGYNGPAGR